MCIRRCVFIAAVGYRGYRVPEVTSTYVEDTVGVAPINSVGIELLTCLVVGCSASSEYVNRRCCPSVGERGENEVMMLQNSRPTGELR